METDKQIDMAAVIKKYGEQARRAGGKGGTFRRICCDACGGWIWEDEADEAEYIGTKRGSKLFFHNRCLRAQRRRDNGQKAK